MFPDGNSQRASCGPAAFGDDHAKPDARRRFWRRLVPGVLLLVLLVGCGQEATPAPTSILVPTVMPTIFTLATPLPPTAVLPTVPAGRGPISPQNASGVVEFARWGKGSTNEVTFSPDGKIIAVADAFGVYLYNVSNLSQILHRDASSSINSVAFSPDGQTLASGFNEGTLTLWRVSGGSSLHTLRERDTSDSLMRRNTEPILSVAFSPDGQTLASGIFNESTHLWRVSDGSLLRTLGSSHANSVAFSPDGQTLTSGTYDGTVELWRVSDGSLLRTLEGHSNTVYGVAFSRDGQTLASGSADNTVKLWRVSDGSLLRTLEGHTDSVQSVAFSPDGQTLASGSWDGTVRLWRVSNGSLLRTLEGNSKPVLSVAFSPDGQTLASGFREGDDTVRLWRVK